MVILDRRRLVVGILLVVASISIGGAAFGVDRPMSPLLLAATGVLIGGVLSLLVGLGRPSPVRKRTRTITWIADGLMLVSMIIAGIAWFVQDPGRSSGYSMIRWTLTAFVFGLVLIIALRNDEIERSL